MEKITIFTAKLIFFLFSAICAFGEYAIVFIHIGNEIPPYADVAISQARLFNPNATIYLLGSHKALGRFEQQRIKENINLCPLESLNKTNLHKKYRKKCNAEGFWRVTSERFLYLWDLIDAHSLKNVFHLENDNMLYANLEPLLPYFQEFYPGIAAPFDNEDRCIPGFVWISGKNAMESLAEYFVKKASEKDLFDMYVIGNYRKRFSSERIDRLPIIMENYGSQYPLISTQGHKTNNPKAYSNHAEEFESIFDAACIGQYLGGIAPCHQQTLNSHFINESSLFNPSYLDYQWLPDDQGRMIPYAIFQNKYYKIINLHIHSKRLEEFRS